MKATDNTQTNEFTKPTKTHREIKITDEMSNIPGIPKYVFWNSDENGKPIDQELFNWGYKIIMESKENYILDIRQVI